MGWVGGEELTKSGSGDGVLTTTHILVSGIFRQRMTFIVVLDVVTKFSKIGSFFFLQMKCMLSASVEIISY